MLAVIYISEDMPLDFEAVERAVLLADHILLLTDSRSDGDTFGSSLAFSHYLKSRGKRVSHYATSPILDIHGFLPGIEDITRDEGILTDATVDLVIVFDSSREELVYGLVANMPSPFQLIVFDHHASNTNFGDVNVVDAGSASTCEVVHSYFLNRNISITPDMAKCLLTGVITDTRLFENTATNASALQTASFLLSQGGSLKKVVRHVMQSVSVDQLKLWGTVLSRMVHSRKHKVAITWITQRDLDSARATEEDISELTDYIAGSADVSFLMFLKEREDGIKVSLRSGSMDVLPIAKAFGGGGHPGACGFTLHGKSIKDIL